VTLLVGLLISIFQAATQINEMTLSFIPKLLAVGAALVLLGDSPGVDPAIIAALVAAYEQTSQPIAVPFYGDEPGPPTLFARPLFPDLVRLQGDTGGRLIVRHYPDHVARVDFPAAARPPDIDTPDDYQAAVSRP
jgi:molybdenum cofactor cytidylyltransferase